VRRGRRLRLRLDQPSSQRTRRRRPSAGTTRHPHHRARGTAGRVQLPAHQPGTDRRQPLPAPRRTGKRRAHHPRKGLRRQTRPHLDHHHQSGPRSPRRGDHPAQAPDQPDRTRWHVAGLIWHTRPLIRRPGQPRNRADQAADLRLTARKINNSPRNDQGPGSGFRPWPGPSR